MKLVIQRVDRATVTEVESSKVVGEIEQGLFILLGVKRGDTEETAISLAQKLLKLRIFEEERGKMNLSVVDTKSSVLVVSQFTLMASTKDGNRPSFAEAEEPTKARKVYETFISELKKQVKVQSGSFGKYMNISASLDGPVTILLKS